eukprot:scaffold526_cov230-Pinguiococcus_pyrenoidosus.AAC.14
MAPSMKLWPNEAVDSCADVCDVLQARSGVVPRCLPWRGVAWRGMAWRGVIPSVRAGRGLHRDADKRTRLDRDGRDEAYEDDQDAEMAPWNLGSFLQWMNRRIMDELKNGRTG